MIIVEKVIHRTQRTEACVEKTLFDRTCEKYAKRPFLQKEKNTNIKCRNMS